MNTKKQTCRHPKSKNGDILLVQNSPLTRPAIAGLRNVYFWIDRQVCLEVHHD